MNVTQITASPTPSRTHHCRTVWLTTLGTDARLCDMRVCRAAEVVAWAGPRVLQTLVANGGIPNVKNDEGASAVMLATRCWSMDNEHCG